MQIAPAALLIALCLLIAGYFQRATWIVTLFGSFAFGATAVVTLGGASVQLYVPLAALFIWSAVRRREVWSDLGQVLKMHWSPIVVLALLVYVTAGAFILPRLFEGSTTVFVPIAGKYDERPLGPVPGNVNQACYFALGVAAYFACCIMLLRGNSFALIRRAFFTFVSLHVVLGLIDLAGKAMGAGDVLAPIRTANYAMLIESQVAGFWRVAGGFPEASSYGSIAVAGLAFSFSYWRATGSLPAFVIAASSLFIIIVSTSSTAYGGLAVLLVLLCVSILLRGAKDRFETRDVHILLYGLVIVAVLLVIVAENEHLLEPVNTLINSSVFEKSTSDSARERLYWNQKSWQSIFDTAGLGIGLGSSRASGSIYAVPSQMGVPGALLLLSLIVYLVLPLRAVVVSRSDAEVYVLCRSLRSAGFALVVAAAISGGGADPGALFFLISACLLMGRVRLRPVDRQSASTAAVRSTAAQPSVV